MPWPTASDALLEAANLAEQVGELSRVTTEALKGTGLF